MTDWFYGISNIVGYLIPNPVYIYILFSKVKPKLNSKHLNFPGKELNVTDITEQ